MNDITALMATMKAAALKAKSEANEWGYDTDAFHDEATPDAVIQVVEALEKAQHDSAINWEAAASLNVENQELKQSIAELEKAATEPVAYIEQSKLEALSRGVGAVYVKNTPELARPVALFTVSPAQEFRTVTEPQSDYFASLVAMARVSADKAMRKFPQPNYVLLKVAEEAGEVVQAGVHYAEKRMEWEQVEGEIVQLLAMLIRLVTEGDQINGVTPPASCAAGINVEAE
ncbi:hypothetical protein [Citrobacter europaeus]|uniref:hypothetical protein n=1 Tax=Citrobacter europaeus TaxID=1914243 RepID=UPI0020228C5E|nr:hypothetical protein [Citrobacter europaeus]